MSDLASLHPALLAGATRPVTAVAFDGRVDVDNAVAQLGWQLVRRYPYGAALLTPAEDLVYVFSFGALVLVGQPSVESGVQARLEAATGRRLLIDTADSWELAVSSEAPRRRARVGWQRVVLPELSPELTAVTVLLLGQSAALERFEDGADSLVRDARRMSAQLVERGRPPWGLRALSVQVGRVNRDRLDMAEQLYILDRPEETWVDPAASALYDELLANLELVPRREAILSKLAAVEGATELVIDLWQGRESRWLEWAIVLLIVFEVVLMVGETLLG